MLTSKGQRNHLHNYYYIIRKHTIYLFKVDSQYGNVGRVDVGPPVRNRSNHSYILRQTERIQNILLNCPCSSCCQK